MSTPDIIAEHTDETITPPMTLEQALRKAMMARFEEPSLVRNERILISAIIAFDRDTAKHDPTEALNYIQSFFDDARELLKAHE